MQGTVNALLILGAVIATIVPRVASLMTGIASLVLTRCQNAQNVIKSPTRSSAQIVSQGIFLKTTSAVCDPPFPHTKKNKTIVIKQVRKMGIVCHVITVMFITTVFVQVGFCRPSDTEAIRIATR